jgi:hypothetical protein
MRVDIINDYQLGTYGFAFFSEAGEEKKDG